MKTKESLIHDSLAKIKFKQELELTQDDINASFMKIKERIDSQSQLEIPVVKRINFYSRLPFRVAASIILLVTISLFGYNYFVGNKQIEIANNSESVKLIQMSDGSKISLRKGTTLAYRNDFQNVRNVELKGEALFEVAKDKKHPFTVKTKLGRITVLGTVFSVRSFPEETYTKALLKEGSVKFADNKTDKSVLLHPGEEVRLNNASQMKVYKVKYMDRELAWQSHNFSFDNESLDVILSVISDAFNEKMEIKNKDLFKQRYTLKFNRNESFERIIEVLSEVAKFKYKIESDNVVVQK